MNTKFLSVHDSNQELLFVDRDCILHVLMREGVWIKIPVPLSWKEFGETPATLKVSGETP